MLVADRIEKETKRIKNSRSGSMNLPPDFLLVRGKYPSMEVMAEALEASGAEVVTVAVRRVKISESESLLDYIDTKNTKFCPIRRGCYSADEAIRVARLAREAGMSDMIKLEVLGDEKHSCPTPSKR